jgi:hypothetical protein
MQEMVPVSKGAKFPGGAAPRPGEPITPTSTKPCEVFIKPYWLIDTGAIIGNLIKANTPYSLPKR